METLFRTVLQMSGTGAIVICVVLLVRLMLKRAPKRYSYWLWAAAGFRLVCPVSFRSVFSVFSLAPSALPAVPAQTGGGLGPAVGYVQPTVGAVQPPPTPVPTLPPALGQGAAVSPVPEAAAQASAPAMTLLGVLGIVWLAGVAAMLLWGALSYLRLARRLGTAVRLYDNVWQTDAVDSPFLLGFFRPRIYIPFGLEGERLDYVLAHERFHISCRDHLVKLLAFLILALHWFDPLVWLAFVLMGRDMEMRCDEHVLGRGAAASKPYSETLLSFAVGGRFPRPGPLAFGESGVKARIKNALRWKKPRTWVTVCAALLCAAAVAACAANPSEPAAEEDPVQTDPPTADAAVPTPGANSSVEMYLRNGVLRDSETDGVTAYRTDGSAVNVSVTETELAELMITGTLDGLAPEGQLQSWRYRVRLVLAEDAPALAPTDDMTEENGRYVLERTHDLVALVYPNDRVDVLYDAPVGDNMSFYGYHNSYEEAIYDWYVTANSLGMPLYVMDWGAGLSLGGNYPVHRYDGDGWFLYVPIAGWRCTEASAERTEWTSAYDTGSTVAVRRATEAEANAEYEYLKGVAEYYYVNYTAYGAEYWCVSTCYDPKIQIMSSLAGKEPEILQRMAESFRMNGPSTAYATEPWRQSYLTFFRDTLLPTYSGARTDKMIYGTALMDFDFDGVPELIVWDCVAGGAAYCTVYRIDDTGAVRRTEGEFNTNILTGRISDRPAVRPAQTRAFWLAQDRETGAYVWCVHSGNGQDERAWGSYILLDGADTLLTEYDVTGGWKEAMEAAWETFIAHYELLDIDYSGFTLSVYQITSITEERFGDLLMHWQPLSLETELRYPRTLQQLIDDDQVRFARQTEAWNAQIDMIGEQFTSTLGEAGDWADVERAFAERWLEKHLNADADNPHRCSGGEVMQIASYLNAATMTHAPLRLAFNVSLALDPQDEDAFVTIRAGWATPIEAMGWANRTEYGVGIHTEAVLRSDDGVHWTVESLNSGGTAGWGFRHLPLTEGDYMTSVLPYLFSGDDIYGLTLLQFLPNLDWPSLTAEQFNTVSERLRAAAVKTPELDLGADDQLIRDLYMLWGMKNADGAYAELFLDGPDSLLARQYRADPDAFLAALGEMDAQTQRNVRLSLGL